MVPNMSKTNLKLEIVNPSQNKPNTAKTKNTLLKSNFQKSENITL